MLKIAFHQTSSVRSGVFIQRVANIISIHSKVRDINSFNSSCYIEIKCHLLFDYT